MTLPRVIHGDMLVELPKLHAAGERFHACVCDPPYNLTTISKRFGKEGSAPAQHGTDGAFARASRGFMNAKWDTAIAFYPETWRAVYDVLLPGAYLVAFASTRGYHRMVCAIEDAGFVIHPMLAWVFGSGFPKAADASKAIDRHLGGVREVVGFTQGRSSAVHNGRQSVGCPDAITAPATPEAAAWEGWKYGLQSMKPAVEPICCAQKPFNVCSDLPILAESTNHIEALLWSLAPVKFAEWCSTHTGLPDVSVRWFATVLHKAQCADISEMMDTFSSPETASTFLSIAYLWNAILDANCSQQSTSTIETASSLTTGLRTLNCWISAITPASIIQVATHQNGLWSDASNVPPTLVGNLTSFSGIHPLSARASVTEGMAREVLHSLADIAASH